MSGNYFDRFDPQPQPVIRGRREPLEQERAAAGLNQTVAQTEATRRANIIAAEKLALDQAQEARIANEAATSRNQNARKMAETNAMFTRDSITGLREIDRIEADVRNNDWGETGFSGAMMSVIPGTAAHDLRTDTSRIGGLSILNKLVEAKNAMPEGAQGLFGATNQAELDALKASMSNLNPNDSNQNFRKGLQDARQSFYQLLLKSNPAAAEAYRKGREKYQKQYGFGGLTPPRRRPAGPPASAPRTPASSGLSDDLKRKYGL